MYKFKIESLSCMNCFNKIENSLKEFDPTITAKADIRSRLLTVETTHSAETVKKIIEEAGYRVDGP